MTQAMITLEQDKSRSIGIFADPLANEHTESGVGALLPWANRLYFSTYLAMANDGAGTYVGYLDRNFVEHTVLRTDGIHTGRMIHRETNQALIGPCVIEKNGAVHIVSSLVSERVSGYARHIVSPTTKVYALTMEGKLYEVDLTTYTATLIINIKTTLSQTRVHYKACWTHAAPFATTDRVICVSNVQSNPPDAPNSGALVSVDPVGLSASVKDNASWIEVSGDYYPGNGGHTYAFGKDHKSPILGVVAVNNGSVYRYRLPQATKSLDWYIDQEWMRIRPLTTERLMGYAYGTWYHMSTWLAHAASNGVENYGSEGADYPIIEPIARYIDTITDAAVFNGKFVLGTNNMSFHKGAFPNAGQPQSCLKLGDMEDIWRGGKPTGKGYLWYKEAVTSGTASDPILIRGYDKKSIQILNGSASAMNVAIRLIDYSDSYTLATVAVAAGAFVTYQIPSGVCADWLRLVPDAAVTPVTAWLECS